MGTPGRRESQGEREARLREEFVPAPRMARPVPAYRQGEVLDEYGYPLDQTATSDDRGAQRAVTPARVSLVLAVLVALALLAYAVLLERGGMQIPILVGGLALMGLALLGLSATALASAVHAGRAGHGGRAVTAAMFGGMCALAASGFLGSAVVFGLIWGSVRG